MIYQTTTQRQQAIDYFKKLIDQDCTIEIKKKMPKRSNPQNRYLHLILSYFALETGYNLEYTKRHFFKYVANFRTFITEVDGKLGKVQQMRSSADLDSKEMTICIERFKEFSINEAGILLPDAEDQQWLNEIHNLIENSSNSNYL